MVHGWTASKGGDAGTAMTPAEESSGQHSAIGEEKVRKTGFATALLLTTLVTFGVPGPVMALLARPEGFICSVAASLATCSWGAVTEASKYSVDVVAQYDTDGDSVVDQSLEFDFSAVETTLDILLDVDLAHDFGAGLVSPSVVTLRVKALNPGKGSGRQNNPFSDSVTIVLP